MNAVAERSHHRGERPRSSCGGDPAPKERPAQGAGAGGRALFQKPALRPFEQPSTARAAWQVVDSLVPYLATLALMYLTIRYRLPLWTTLALAVPASGFMVRLFILMHDCTHSSFLRSRRAQQVLGGCLGVLVFTPFSEWRRSHLAHHATSGDLGRRGEGDMWMLTVEEYVTSSRMRRLTYRLVRNPLLMLLVGPLLIFVFSNLVLPRAVTRERVLSIVYTDLAIAAIVVLAALTIGLRAYMVIQLPVLFLGGVWGIWLFYVQHQFDPSYFARSEEWDPVKAALRGSSYYQLPRVLQWFSGNIGLHHVHHLRPRIPNYNLQRCLDANADLQVLRPLTLAGSIGCARLALWDERKQAFVSFRDVARRGNAAS